LARSRGAANDGERDGRGSQPVRTPHDLAEGLIPRGALQVAGAAERAKVIPLVVEAVAVDVVDLGRRGGDVVLVPADAAEGFLGEDDLAELLPRPAVAALGRGLLGTGSLDRHER